MLRDSTRWNGGSVTAAPESWPAKVARAERRTSRHESCGLEAAVFLRESIFNTKVSWRKLGPIPCRKHRLEFTGRLQMGEERRGVDVCATNHEAHPATLKLGAQRAEHRGGGRGAGGLDCELHFTKQKPHTGANLIIVHKDEFIDVVAADPERKRGGVRSTQAVGDGLDRIDALR